VHRGQGFRSLSSDLIARVGVPPEMSILTVHVKDLHKNASNERAGSSRPIENA